jgi:hypothetical protein
MFRATTSGSVKWLAGSLAGAAARYDVFAPDCQHIVATAPGRRRSAKRSGTHGKSPRFIEL